MKKSNIENIKVVADAENAQPHFCCSHIIFSILDFFTVLFFGCRKKGLNCYLIMGSRGIRSGVFCLLLRCIFQKIFKSCKTSYLENLENILSAYFQGISTIRIFLFVIQFADKNRYQLKNALFTKTYEQAEIFCPNPPAITLQF